MAFKLERFGLSKLKIFIAAMGCLFALVSMLIVYVNKGATFDYFYCLATIPFVCLPIFLSLIFKWKMNLGFYIIFVLYALGPILGAVYKFYYLTSWWDDLLHGLAGALFAVFGAYLAIAINKSGKTYYLLAALFGLFFTIAIAVFWEFFEYSSDVLLGSDMQADTIVNHLATKMGRTDGGVSVFEGISEVVIDGKNLGLGGYIDIGLVDTINDMAVETAGGIVYLIYVLVDRDRHPLIINANNI